MKELKMEEMMKVEGGRYVKHEESERERKKRELEKIYERDSKNKSLKNRVDRHDKLEKIKPKSMRKDYKG